MWCFLFREGLPASWGGDAWAAGWESVVKVQSHQVILKVGVRPGLGSLGGRVWGPGGALGTLDPAVSWTGEAQTLAPCSPGAPGCPPGGAGVAGPWGRPRPSLGAGESRMCLSEGQQPLQTLGHKVQSSGCSRAAWGRGCLGVTATAWVGQGQEVCRGPGLWGTAHECPPRQGRGAGLPCCPRAVARGQQRQFVGWHGTALLPGPSCPGRRPVCRISCDSSTRLPGRNGRCAHLTRGPGLPAQFRPQGHRPGKSQSVGAGAGVLVRATAVPRVLSLSHVAWHSLPVRGL